MRLLQEGNSPSSFDKLRTGSSPSHQRRGTPINSPSPGGRELEGGGYKHKRGGNRNELALARQLRSQQTDAEKALWTRLRQRQLEDVKFRRQQPISQYVVDFVSFERKLVIEIDGGQHSGEGIRDKDEQRTTWLKKGGYRVLRFWNNEVLMNIEGVLERIRETLDEASPSPSLSRQGRGTPNSSPRQPTRRKREVA